MYSLARMILLTTAAHDDFVVGDIFFLLTNFDEGMMKKRVRFLATAALTLLLSILGYSFVRVSIVIWFFL